MNGLKIRKEPCELDFLSLGALVHRLDPGGIPFRKARSFDVHVSGGEYNVAAGVSGCFRLRPRIGTAMGKKRDGEVGGARGGGTRNTPPFQKGRRERARG